MNENMVLQVKDDLTRKYWGYEIIHAPEYKDYVKYKTVCHSRKKFLFFTETIFSNEIDYIIRKEDMDWEKLSGETENWFCGHHWITPITVYLYCNWDKKLILFR